MNASLIWMALVLFIDLLGFGIVIPILPYYAEHFGAGGWELGWIMTSYSFMQFLFSPLWGKWSDKWGRKPILLMSICGNAIAMLALGFSTELWMVFAARIFAGIFAANISTAYAYASDVTSDENRTKAMGLLGAAMGLGFTFGPGIGGILSEYGQSVPMFFASALAFLNFFLGFFILKESRKETTAPSTGSRSLNPIQSLKNWKNALKTPLSGPAIFAFFTFTLATTQLETIFAIYMGSQFGFNAKTTGLYLLALGMIMVLVQGGGLRSLSKRFQERQMSLFGTLVGGLSLIGFALSGSVGWTFAFLAILAICRGITQPSFSSLTSKGAPEGETGRYMGYFHSSGSLARVLGPVAAGLLFDQVHPSAPFIVGGALLLITFVFARKNLFFSERKN